MAILDRLCDPDPPYAAMARARLALRLQRAGQSQNAEDLLRSAQASIERSLGPEHPWFVHCLVTLASLRSDAGDTQEAETIGRRAVSLLERIHQTGTILAATVLNSLGDLSRQRNDLKAAD